MDRCLHRVPDDVRRYHRAVEFMACDGCEVCAPDSRDPDAHDPEPREPRRERGSGRNSALRRPIRLGD